MNSRAARALAVVVIGLSTLGIVTPASAASTTAGTASISLSSTDFSAAKKGSPLHLELSVEDTVGAGIDAGTATVRVSRTAFSSRSAVSKWLDGSTKDSAVATTVAHQSTPIISAGETRAVAVDVASKSLGFGRAGVYAVSVTVTIGDSTIGGARSVVSWNPSSTNPVPFAIAAPLTLPASATEFISAKTLEEATAPDGVLTRKLDDLLDTPVAIGIDPRIIASIRVLGNTAPQSARDWLDRLAGVTNETFPLAWADADLTVAQQAGARVVPRVKPLTYAVDPDRFATPTPSTDTASATATSTPTSTPTPDPGSGESTDPPLPTSNEDLTHWDYTITQLAWPADNTVTRGDMTKFGIAGVAATILSSSNTKRSASGNSVAAAASIGAIRVATSDEQLSGYLADAVQATTRAASNAAATNLAAALDEIAITSAGPTPVVFATLPRNWDDDGIALDRTLTAVYGRSWVTTSTLSEVLSAKATATSIISKPQAADRVDLVRAMLVIEARGVRFAPVVDEPETLTSSRRLLLLAILSDEWVGDDAGWSTAARGFIRSGRAIVRSVQVKDSSQVLFLGSSGLLPITIDNAYAQGVTVYVTLHPATTLLSVDGKYTDYKVTIPPNSQSIVRVPAESLSNGKVKVTVTLKSITGRVVGSEKTVGINVQAGWESVGTFVVAALVLGIFGFGLFRSIRKRRRARLMPASEPLPDAEPETTHGE